jgi:hypothetical protein
MVVVTAGEKRPGKCYLIRRISVWEDEKVRETDGGDECSTK